MLALILIFWFSSQQGKNSYSMSINICKKIVMFFDYNVKLGLDEKQFMNFVKFLDIPIRKAAHMAEYAVLGAILYVIVSSHYQSIWKKIICVCFFLVLIGCVDELHQLYVIARDGKWQDVVIDVFGGNIGMLLVCGCKKRD